MTVEELMEILEGMDPEMKVNLAMQPSWPMEYTIDGAVEVEGTLYLYEGTQTGYLPEEVTKELGW